jgi:hypothetical protein
MAARTGPILLPALAVLVLSRNAPGAPTSGQVNDADAYDLSAYSETHAALFRRALLPGPSGALVETDTVVPVHEYLRLRARDLDTGWRKNSVDVELAAWGRAWFGERETERRLDGDVQTAYAGYRDGPLALRLGRQHFAGGAARYARFDGLSAALGLGAGLEVEGYGGFSVLPRWDARPGYHHLGAAADSLLRDPDALPDPERSGNLLGGGRFGYAASRGSAAASFHEQHEDQGLMRRTLGLDGRVLLIRDLSLDAGGVGLFELDAERISDARFFADVTPLTELDLSVEYLHTEPALFLSRQSVMSVFSTDAYDEAGGSALVHVTPRLSLEGEGSIQFYSLDDRGARGEIAARAFPGAGKRTYVRVGYTRVVAPGNGYHSLRASLSRRITPVLSGTLEAYNYLYDESIRGRTSSEVYSGTLGYQAADALHLLWGASVAVSPYAAFDAQTLVRASYDFDYSTHKEAP